MKSRMFRSLVLVAGLGFIASAAEATVLRVVTVESDNADNYVKELEHGKALMKKAGSPGILRVWRSRCTCREPGVVVVSVEYSDVEALTKDKERMGTNPEFQAWLKGLDKTRKVVSETVYEEQKP